MKASIKKIGIALIVTVMFISCNKEESNENLNSEFPEGIVSYNFPLGTTNIQGQSPISINTSDTEKMNTTDPVIHYNAITLNSVENTNENLRVNLSTTDKANNYIMIKGLKYELQQFHFHRHSEHNVNGEYGTMELHFVNKSETGAYAVLGVVIKSGSVSSAMKTLIDASPATTGINTMTDIFYLNSILPSDTGKYYSYNGSLTTPNLDSTPNQGPVTWIVFKNNIEMTDDQLESYATKYEEENFREIQPINNRTVYENIR
ncbi:carbonic anhydrase family protein [Flavobacterium piscis]|uniref:carbonic anhydrase n=1 Tax=Flavobacterium piscis TaxID=1114874 RepID=A0ABU1YCT6_9FLAO|nr:carbonic anhydrase family protein [Flavobacterium piscis]MDR7212055.1 carbonic anhydrase [Flavobacterium piscis]